MELKRAGGVVVLKLEEDSSWKGSSTQAGGVVVPKLGGCIHSPHLLAFQL